MSEGWVYAAEMDQQLWKVGYTGDVKRRKRALEDEFCAFMENGAFIENMMCFYKPHRIEAYEQHVHAKLNQYRLSREESLRITGVASVELFECTLVDMRGAMSSVEEKAPEDLAPSQAEQGRRIIHELWEQASKDLSDAMHLLPGISEEVARLGGVRVVHPEQLDDLFRLDERMKRYIGILQKNGILLWWLRERNSFLMLPFFGEDEKVCRIQALPLEDKRKQYEQSLTESANSGEIGRHMRPFVRDHGGDWHIVRGLRNGLLFDQLGLSVIATPSTSKFHASWISQLEPRRKRVVVVSNVPSHSSDSLEAWVRSVEELGLVIERRHGLVDSVDSLASWSKQKHQAS